MARLERHCPVSGRLVTSPRGTFPKKTARVGVSTRLGSARMATFLTRRVLLVFLEWPFHCKA